ncbi:hypothetical protein LPW36_15790 [Jinshanibacter sp. LJY008]|uniref:Uncharacterized protein n=1 Tax=Limnobaculum eriocheiris TaxID=2897391 RepID=A0A9X1N145_9GAMM|nr:hypothetical protein [Limnobaculum eriocheiris]MCD1127437.1 hypothetical protein [Limnobaculum eriocheiris]
MGVACHEKEGSLIREHVKESFNVLAASTVLAAGAFSAGNLLFEKYNNIWGLLIFTFCLFIYIGVVVGCYWVVVNSFINTYKLLNSQKWKLITLAFCYVGSALTAVGIAVFSISTGYHNI